MVQGARFTVKSMVINVSREKSAGVDMKRTLIMDKTKASAALLCLLIGVAVSAHATDRFVATERFTEFAKVIDVQPIYREVRSREPREQCWTEQVEQIVGYEDTTHYRHYQPRRYQRDHSSGDTLVGGLIGGVIGNQLGRGRGNRTRTGATVAGAIIGSALANETRNHSNRNRHYSAARHTQSRPIYEIREVERCKRATESHSQRRLKHYNVTYQYKGRNFVTQLPRDPGERIELQVSVAPARR